VSFFQHRKKTTQNWDNDYGNALECNSHDYNYVLWNFCTPINQSCILKPNLVLCISVLLMYVQDEASSEYGSLIVSSRSRLNPIFRNFSIIVSVTCYNGWISNRVSWYCYFL